MPVKGWLEEAVSHFQFTGGGRNDGNTGHHSLFVRDTIPSMAPSTPPTDAYMPLGRSARCSDLSFIRTVWGVAACSAFMQQPRTCKPKTHQIQNASNATPKCFKHNMAQMQTQNASNSKSQNASNQKCFKRKPKLLQTQNASNEPHNVNSLTPGGGA